MNTYQLVLLEKAIAKIKLAIESDEK